MGTLLLKMLALNDIIFLKTLHGPNKTHLWACQSIWASSLHTVLEFMLHYSIHCCDVFLVGHWGLGKYGFALVSTASDRTELGPGLNLPACTSGLPDIPVFSPVQHKDFPNTLFSMHWNLFFEARNSTFLLLLISLILPSFMPIILFWLIPTFL